MTPKNQESKKAVRTTISLAYQLHQDSLEVMQEEGFNNNFSAFIAFLIREHKKQVKRRKSRDHKRAAK